jgi:cysteinyl-tRNA synthetase
MLRTHYRSPFNFSDAHLDDARSALRRLYGALDATAATQVPTIDWTTGPAARFRAAMDDDFNTPAALAVLFELASDVHRTRDAASAGQLKALGGVLGLLQQDPRSFLRSGAPRDKAEGLDAAAIEERIQARAAAKKARDFSAADAIRAELAAMGVELKDTPQGTTWVRA